MTETEKLLQEIYNKIDTLGQDLKQELSVIKQDINDLKVQTGKLEEKISGVDTRLKTVETGIIPLLRRFEN
jgi:chromosome segregation ATPase